MERHCHSKENLCRTEQLQSAVFAEGVLALAVELGRVYDRQPWRDFPDLVPAGAAGFAQDEDQRLSAYGLLHSDASAHDGDRHDVDVHAGV